MTSREQIESWAKLYDLGHRNFDGWNSEESANARKPITLGSKSLFAYSRKTLETSVIPRKAKASQDRRYGRCTMKLWKRGRHGVTK